MDFKLKAKNCNLEQLFRPGWVSTVQQQKIARLAYISYVLLQHFCGPLDHFFCYLFAVDLFFYVRTDIEANRRTNSLSEGAGKMARYLTIS